MPDARPDLHWQDKAGATWARLHRQTDAQLGPFGRVAIERLRVALGERVLDVGCGAGQTLLELGERVGPAGTVTGLDISEPLLAAASERVRAARIQNVDVVLGDAARHGFGVPFHAVFSRFGVMFFEDMVAGFRNLRRALRPGGRLGFVCWQSAEKNPWHGRLLAAVRAVLPDAPPPDMLAPGSPGPFRLSDAEEVDAILSEAGFQERRIEPVELDMDFGGTRTLEEAVAYALEIGPAARFAGDADPTLRPEFEAALATALAPHVSDRGVRFEAAALAVTAQG